MEASSRKPYCDRKQAHRLDVDLLAGLLVEGENVLEVENVADTGQAYSIVMLDRFRIDYPKLWNQAAKFVIDVTDAEPVWLRAGVDPERHLLTLIALGTGAAFGYSLVATLAPGLFPDRFRGHVVVVGVYFEAAAVIVTLVLLGQVLELRARDSTSGALKALLGLGQKRRGSFVETVARKTSLSRTSKRGCTSASDPVRRCRWTASSSEARAPSTSPW